MLKKMPSSIGAERTVLSAALNEPMWLVKLGDKISRDDWYDPQHAAIWDTATSLYYATANDPDVEVNASTVAAALDTVGILEKCGGVDYLGDLNVYSSLHNAPKSLMKEVGRILDSSRRRHLIEDLHDITQSCMDTSVPSEELVGAAMSKIAAHANVDDSSCGVTLAEATREAILAVERRSRGELSGIPTPWPSVTQLLSGGIEGGSVTVIAARPSTGKTAFALNWLSHASGLGTPGVLFSLESGSGSIALRMLSTQSGVSLRRLRAGKMLDTDWSRLTVGGATNAKLPVRLIDTPRLTVSDIAVRTHKLHAEGRCGIIAIDHLSEVKTKHTDSRTRELEEACYDLRELARNLNIPVVIISQLNRASESRKDGRPLMSDLRDSGAIEQVADAILLLHRPGKYDENADERDAEVDIVKQRDGATGRIPLWFDGSTVKFTERGNQ